MKTGDIALAEVGYQKEWAIVRIMAIAEGWAMVRRKGAMPFCVMVKELRAAVDAAKERGE